MIDSVPLIQNPNDAQQINASIIAMKKASRELDEKIAQFNKLLSQEITNREKAITEAINSLDVASVGGSGKYISAISETDGKISATASDITPTVSSGNSQPVTSGGVASVYYQGVKYGANYDCDTMGEGLAIVNEQTLNTPYKQGLTTATIAYILTKSISSGSEVYNVYRIQFAVSYSGNELFVRSYTDNNGWTAWQRELRNIDLTSAVTYNSTAPITSGGVFSALSAKLGWAIETYNGQNRAWTIPTDLEQGIYLLFVTDLYQNWEYSALGLFYNYTSAYRSYRPILEYGLNVSVSSDVSQLQVQSGRYMYRIRLLKIGY